MGDDRAQKRGVVVCQPLYHALRLKVHRAGDIAEITARIHAPSDEHET